MQRTDPPLRSFGPRQVLAEETGGCGRDRGRLPVRFLGGAVCGSGGTPPADLDVLVIGKPDRDALDDAAQRAGERVAREVNVTIRSPQWWREGTDGFHAEITRRPIVPVLGADG